MLRETYFCDNFLQGLQLAMSMHKIGEKTVRLESFRLKNFKAFKEVEMRNIPKRGGQVFVSTHSPDFLNAVNLKEVFWMEKENGYSKIIPAKSDSQVEAFMRDGDKMGYLWKQGFFGRVDPR